VALFARHAVGHNRPMGLRILEQNDWLILGESTDARPVCVFCSWYEPHAIRIGNDAPLEEWYCRRHIAGWRGFRVRHLFTREPGADDE
jgi:hypothetical protein